MAIGLLVLFEDMVMGVIAIVIVYELWRMGLYRSLQCRTSCAMGVHLESLGEFRFEHLSPPKTDSPTCDEIRGIHRSQVHVFLYYICGGKEVVFVTALHHFACRIVVVSVFSPIMARL